MMAGTHRSAKRKKKKTQEDFSASFPRRRLSSDRKGEERRRNDENALASDDGGQRHRSDLAGRKKSWTLIHHVNRVQREEGKRKKKGGVRFPGRSALCPAPYPGKRKKGDKRSSTPFP